MQGNIQKIIAVLNDFSMVDEVLRKTYAFAEKYNALVQILYVHETPLFDVPDYFRSDTENSTIDKAKIKASIEEKIEMFETQKQTVVFVQIDDTENRVWTLAREEKETLIITAYHEDITKRLLHKIIQPVLILKNNTHMYTKIAVMLNTNSPTDACIEGIKKHFSKSKITLLYDYRYMIILGMEADIQSVQIIEESEKKSFADIKKRSGFSGEFFIEGNLQDISMSEYLQNNAFDMLYICSHREDLFLVDNFTTTMLDTLTCDILVSSH